MKIPYYSLIGIISLYMLIFRNEAINSNHTQIKNKIYLQPDASMLKNPNQVLFVQPQNYFYSTSSLKEEDPDKDMAKNVFAANLNEKTKLNEKKIDGASRTKKKKTYFIQPEDNKSINKNILYSK